MTSDKRLVKRIAAYFATKSEAYAYSESTLADLLVSVQREMDLISPMISRTLH